MKKVIEGRISSGFGKRVHPVTGIESFHNGVDIAAAIGTFVYSPCDGRVADVYAHATGGKTIIMADDVNNTRYGFCHLSDYLVKKGDRIRKGQTIAKSGNTGLGTGAHLHFTVKTGGKWQGDVYAGGAFVNPVNHVIID